MFGSLDLQAAARAGVAGRLRTPATTTCAASATADSQLAPQPQPPMQEQRFTWSRQWYPLTAVDNLDPGRPTPITVLGTNLVVWWEAAGSTWRCFRDVCPHRAAPLSGRQGCIGVMSPPSAPAKAPAPSRTRTTCRGQGQRCHGKPAVRICESCWPSTLNAVLFVVRHTFFISLSPPLPLLQHGWQFGGSGAAQDIPQSEPGAAKATACSSPRSCATSYPTTLSHGLLWVRLEPGGAAAAEAAGQDPLPELPSTDERGVAWFPVSPW